MIVAALILIWLAMLAAGPTPTGRALRHWLVEAPARALGRVHRGTVVTLLLMAAILAALATVLEGEAFRFAAMAAPEMAGWIAMFEVSAWVDALAIAVVTASAVRWRAVGAWIVARLSRRATPRARRTRTIVRLEAPSNDDEDPALPIAA